MKQHQIIYEVLKEAKGWVPSYKLTKENTPFGWLGSGADRIARYMVDPRQACYREDIERKVEGKYSYYRIKEGQGSLII